MAIHFLGECNHRLVVMDKPFGSCAKTLHCEICGCEMPDLPCNRDRYDVVIRPEARPRPGPGDPKICA